MERDFNVQNLQVNENAIKKNKKYSLSKIIGIGLISVGLATTSINGLFNTYKIPYTHTDKTNNTIMSVEYNNVLYENAPTILNNIELHNILASTGKSTLSEIETLIIQGPLKNNDLSELRYLTNLKSITIYNSNINISDLKYNQNLKEINLYNSTIINTQDMPNSVMSYTITNSKVNDQQFTLPYNLEKLSIDNSLFYNLHLRCPQNLVQLYLNTKSLVDINIFKNCTNLNSLTIEKTPNILNGKVLTELDSLKVIKLDDYAPIWLNSNDLSKLIKSDFDNNINLIPIARTFDNLANELMENNRYLSKDRIIEIARNFVLNKYTYSEPNYPILYASDYQYPSSSAIHSHNATGIEYSTLFLALANRMNIPACMLYDDQYVEYNSNFYGYEPKENKVWIGFNDGDGFKYLDLALEDREINVKTILTDDGSKRQPDTDYKPINSPLILSEDRIDKNIGFILDEENVKNNTASGNSHKNNVENIYLESSLTSLIGAIVYLSSVLIEAKRKRENSYNSGYNPFTNPYPDDFFEDEIDAPIPYDFNEDLEQKKHKR